MAANPQKIIERVLVQRLKDIDQGCEEYDTSEVLRIKAALDSDRPTVDMVMTTIFNAINYLHKDYQLQSDGEFKSILTFLESFYRHTQQELMSKSSTYKDGLTMQLDSE